ncbi:MAG: hypothetical protein RQ899_09690 [Pseudomonadales bacterium]|nr:hypothetical protein [Pseudomonadales bacterium]
MKHFNFSRFLLLQRDEVLDSLPRLIRYSVALMLIGLVLYGIGVMGASFNTAESFEFYENVFPSVLLLGGTLFTGTIFRALHTPLENIHYLMLPVSTLERLLVKYLASGPLFVLYVMLAYLGFEICAQLLSNTLFGYAAQFVDFSSAAVLDGITSYLKTHAFIFAGAIFFSSYTLVKTVITYLLLMGSGVFLAWQTLRLRFASYFDGWMLVPNENISLDLNIALQPWHFEVLSVLLSGWILYLAYLWLADYEV